jgi:E3 ubiquitin-protein ligase CHFR
MCETESWGQLVSTTDLDSEPIQLVKSKFTVGRGLGNDLRLAENAFVSSSHCFIERDEVTGIVWLHDISTNGTLLNLSNKLHHQKYELKHGDEIFIVNRKDDITHNVAYLYQDLDELRREEALGDSDDSSNDTESYHNQTLPYEASLERSFGDDEKKYTRI